VQQRIGSAEHHRCPAGPNIQRSNRRFVCMWGEHLGGPTVSTTRGCRGVHVLFSGFVRGLQRPVFLGITLQQRPGRSAGGAVCVAVCAAAVQRHALHSHPCSVCQSRCPGASAQHPVGGDRDKQNQGGGACAALLCGQSVHCRVQVELCTAFYRCRAPAEQRCEHFLCEFDIHDCAGLGGSHGIQDLLSDRVASGHQKLAR